MRLCGMQNIENRGEALFPKVICRLWFRFVRAAAPVPYPFTEPQGGGQTVVREGCMALPVLGKDPVLSVRFPTPPPPQKTEELQSATENP